MTKDTDSKSLFAFNIPFSPLLGKTYGMCGALMIQQVHFFCCSKTNLHDGYYWTYQTAKDWIEIFGVFEERTIRAKIKELREAGILVTANYNKAKYDKTLWYRVAYDRLIEDLRQKHPHLQILQDSDGNFCSTYTRDYG